MMNNPPGHPAIYLPMEEGMEKRYAIMNIPNYPIYLVRGFNTDMFIGTELENDKSPTSKLRVLLLQQGTLPFKHLADTEVVEWLNPPDITPSLSQTSKDLLHALMEHAYASDTSYVQARLHSKQPELISTLEEISDIAGEMDNLPGIQDLKKKIKDRSKQIPSRGILEFLQPPFLRHYRRKKLTLESLGIH